MCPGKGGLGGDINAWYFPSPILIWLLAKRKNYTSFGQCNLDSGCPKFAAYFPDSSDITKSLFPWH